MSRLCKSFSFAKKRPFTMLSKVLLLFSFTLASIQLAWGQAPPTFTQGGQQPHDLDGSPAEAVFNGLLYIVYIDHYTHHYSLASSSDGWNFGSGIDSGYGGTSSPTMTAFNGKLYIAFNTGGVIYMMTWNGTSFSAPTPVSWTTPILPPNPGAAYLTPAIVSWNGEIFIAYSASDGYVWSGESTDGIHYFAPVQLPSYQATSSPAAAVFDDGSGITEVAIVYTTNAVGNHNPVTYLTGGGGGISVINSTFEIGGDPTAVSFNGALYVFGRSNYSPNSLWVAGSYNGSGYVPAYQYGMSLHNSPTAAVYNGLLCVGFHSNFSSNHLWTYTAPY